MRIPDQLASKFMTTQKCMQNKAVGSLYWECTGTQHIFMRPWLSAKPSQTFTSPLRLKILWRIWWRLWNSLLKQAPMHIHPKVCIQFMGLWVPKLIHLRLTQLLSSCNNEYGRTCWWREVLCLVLVVMHLRYMWQDIQVEMSQELFKMLPGFVRLCKYV